MKSRLEVITTFTVATLIVFAVLNSSFITANIGGWFRGASTIEDANAQTNLFPVVTARNAFLSNRATLVIDKIGVSAPVVFGTSTDLKSIYSDLEKGVVHYATSPKPGENGASVILGHSSAYPWYKGAYGNVFALLGKLQVGDAFYVEYADGQRFNYVVKQSIIFKPLTEDPRLVQIENTNKPILVLITCWPIGTNYKRIAVEAQLIP